MAFILLFTIIGFLSGLAYVMAKRKIRLGTALTSVMLGLLSWSVWKMFKNYTKGKRFKI